MKIPVGEWLPDQPALGNRGALIAKNVIPWSGNSYKSFPAKVVFSSAITARAQGGYFGRDADANVYNFVGDATKLYELDAAAYTDVSRLAGGAYTTSVEDWWEFATYGQTVIAVNYTDDVQAITLGGANFAALAGSPPKARHIAVVRGFVVLGNINDGNSLPNRVRWSGIGSSTTWTPSLNTLADFQDLEGDGGWVQKVVGGEFGLVFTERAIHRMTFVGYPAVFQFDEIEKARGAFSPQSVIQYGSMVFYLADDGFYATTGAGNSIPIGDGKIDRHFLNDFDTTYWYRVNAAVDPVNKLVMWAYPSTSASNGNPDKIIIYNWVQKRWAFAEVETECFLRYAAEGYTVDTLDTVSASLDALTPTLDSRVWTGGAQSLAAFDSSHRLNTFSGTALDATVDTGETQHFEGRRANVTGVKPLVDGNSASVTIGSRDLQSEAETFGSAISQNSEGVCPARSDARYHRYRVTTTGAFDFIQGVEVEAEEAGKR